MRATFTDGAHIGRPTALLRRRPAAPPLPAKGTDRQALAFHLEILALGWACGFAAGAGLIAIILR